MKAEAIFGKRDVNCIDAIALILGLVLEDIADRFEIRSSTASKTWVKVLAVELKLVSHG